MRLSIITFFLLSTFLGASPAHAIEDNFGISPAVPPTRIESDEKSGVIRFFIKGELAAVLDETGMHVRNGLYFGSTIVDTGADTFDQNFKVEHNNNEE